MSPNTALVLRATGSQGKGVVKALIKKGWDVHAYVTDPSADRAVALQAYGDGVTLHKGTLEDATALEAAIKGCSALFLNQMPSFTGGDGEVREARTVLDVAKATGIKHVVHSTGMTLNHSNAREKISETILAPAVMGKADVEDLVRASGIPWTILRPGHFMTNFTAPMADFMYPGLSEGKFVTSFDPDYVLPLVDTDDVGSFVATAFSDPSKYTGQTISVFSEEVKIKDLVSQISEATGRPIEAVYLSAEEAAKEKDNLMIATQQVIKALGLKVDIEEVKKWGVPLTSFRDFLKREKDVLVPGAKGKINIPDDILKALGK